MAATHPRSILELLTHPNPETRHPNLESNTLSLNHDWYTPARIVEWADFQDLQILKQSFKGRLYEEACRERQGLRCLPEIFDHEKIICDETQARGLITRWTKANVLAAHKPIAEEFHPLLWIRGARADVKNAMPPASPRKPKRAMPDREANKPAKRQRTTRGYRAQSHELGWSYPSFRDFPVGSTHCQGALVINGESPEGSNEIACQEVEAREDGEVDENGGDSRTIFGSDTSKAADVGSKCTGSAELNSEIPRTKPKRDRRKAKRGRPRDNSGNTLAPMAKRQWTT
ncbi:unnamed protein product [Clonostachys chloroleuca]|uniref:Uncharacterized protein n=1 Tax=Clonostachys chloroleuca TaxID=1926264 RepID=A0AA35ME62_9HYPO|nr:unnamed protein product [Clonostachys chloroleuca]